MWEELCKQYLATDLKLRRWRDQELIFIYHQFIWCKLTIYIMTSPKSLIIPPTWTEFIWKIICIINADWLKLTKIKFFLAGTRRCQLKPQLLKIVRRRWKEISTKVQNLKIRIFCRANTKNRMIKTFQYLPYFIWQWY